MGNSYHYNVHFACNNNCIFCASDNTITRKGALKPENIVDSFHRYGVGAGDVVVFNGGEPTLYDMLPYVILAAFKRGAEVILFTNGRLLSDIEYAREVLAGVSKVTVPLYSASPPKHNFLTQTRKGFEETVAGIRNILTLREKQGYDLEIELKCLTIKPCLDENPNIVRFIKEEFGAPDHFVVAGMLFSRTVLQHWEELVPTWEELRDSVIRTLRQAKECSFNAIGLPDVPLCLLDLEALGYFLWRNAANIVNRLKPCDPEQNSCFVYFDAKVPHGWIPEPSEDKPQECSRCKCMRICYANARFMNLIPMALQSIKPLTFEHIEQSVLKMEKETIT